MATNVALVVLDTLRKDAFDEHFEWLKGIKFDHAYSTSHWTTPAHASIFAGGYPSEVGTHAKHLSLDTPNQTLTEKLRDEGWTCRGYSANGNISQNTKFDRGFNEFTAKGYQSSADIFDWEAFIAEHMDEGWGRFPKALVECLKSDCDTLPSLRRGLRRKIDDVRHGGAPKLTVEDALNYVNDTEFGDREFLFVNLMEAHSGHSPPESYQTVEPANPSSIDTLEAVLEPERVNLAEDRFEQTYDDSVRYLSDRYQALHKQLLEDFDYVITVSDHGEAFGEHGIYGHVPALIPSIVHVPLVISGDVSTHSVSTTVSILDIHQTVASLTGVADAPRGQNLLKAEPSSCLAEAHGLNEWQQRELRNRGLKLGSIDRIDGVRRAIAIGEYYGYQFLDDDWITVGDDQVDGRGELDNLVSEFEERDYDNHEVSKNIRSQLRDMGYI